MSILSGYGKFKRYLLTDEGYKLCSQWTSSNTVHFDDDKTAEVKLGAIDGITDSLTATSSNIALSSKAGNDLQNQINELNTGIKSQDDILKRYWMRTNLSGIDDCNSLPINCVGYTYYDTKNSPGSEYVMVFCFGLNDAIRVQIGISTVTGSLKTRGCSNNKWSGWV